MKLFIIGNGFDVAHGLPTKYKDFREYLEEADWSFLTALEAPYGFVPESRRDFVEELLWKDFEKNLCAVNEDEIIDGALSIDMGLEGGDVDIEDTLNEYWEEQYGYIKRLNDYVQDWAKQIDVGILPITTKIKRYAGDLFLTFNYTLTLEKVYKIKEEQILHIHGSVDAANDENPVIGHGDKTRYERMKERAAEASDNFWEKESSIYNAIARYYERTRKDVEFFLRFHNSFFNNLELVNTVVVIGHSWGDVDLPYFKKVLENVKKDTMWHIYFYSDGEEQEFHDKAISIGIAPTNIKMINTTKFYNRK